MVAKLWRRIVYFFSRDRFGRELQEEMQLHRELRAAKLQSGGLSEDDAQNSSRRRFGNELLLKESSWEVWSWRPFEELVQDISYAFRQMLANKAFSAVTIVTLALGIGANTTIFTVFEAVILRSLPVPHPEELRLIQVTGVKEEAAFSHPLYRQMADAIPSGAQLTAVTGIQRGQVAVLGGAPEPGRYQLVSGSFFDTLRVSSSIGRLFTKSDDNTVGGHPVAVISHGYWMRRWSGSPDVLGQVVSVNGQPLTVVGVTSPGFSGLRVGEPVDLWIPLTMQWNVQHFNNVYSYGGDATQPWASQENLFWLQLIGRMPREVDTKATLATLNVIFRRKMEQIYKGSSDLQRHLSKRLEMEAGHRGVGTLRDRFITPLNALLAMSGLVLLIACANIGGLLMSRAESRQREIAVRMSIGAGRGRLIRQLLTESLLLSIVGASIGSFVGVKLGPVLARLLNGGSLAVDLSLHWSVLLFSFCLCVLTTVLFGMAPALRSTKIDLTPALKLAPGLNSSERRFPVGQAMICAQVALSVILLVAAGLLSRTLYNLSHTDPGYQASHLLTVGTNSQLGGYKKEELLPLYQRIESEIRGIPSVVSVSVAQCTLASGGGCGQYSDMYAHGQRVQTQELFVGWDFLGTMGFQLLRGRPFSERDGAVAQQVVIINQTLARFYFGHDDVVGKRLGYSENGPGQFEIIGVLRDTPINNFREAIPHFVLHPIAQDLHPMRTINVRAQGDPASIASAVRAVLQQKEPNLPIYGIRTMTEQIESTFAQEKAVAWLSRLFGGLAAILACLGLYGLLSYRVSRRRMEIGIRMALGARSTAVQWFVLRHAIGWTIAGLAVGFLLSIPATRFLREMLFGVSPTDAVTYAAVLAVLAIVAFLASWLPAYRAARVDPMIALRTE